MTGRLRLIVVLAAAVAATAGPRLAGRGPDRPAVTGTIRGRVEIPGPVVDAGPRPGVASLGVDSTFHARQRRDAVVYLESAPQAAFEAGGPARATMSQENETFVPHVLAVRAGTVVDFPNADKTYHNVFSLSKPRRFDLGRYAKGQSKSVRFDEPGVVRVFCDIHSHMNAFILVFAHRFFSVTDGQGRYRIDRVPPGTYTVAAWYEGAVRQTRAVTVSEDGVSADVDFSVR